MAIVDFSGKARNPPRPATLATSLEPFLADLDHLERLRPHTLRAYRYELAAAAADPRFAHPLDDLQLDELEAWLVRAPAAPSTLGRRVATLRRFFAWACQHGLCRHNPLADRAPLRGRRRLPRPIREQQKERALDAAIAATPQPYRLLFLLLRETGRRIGEVLGLRWADVTLDVGREALRVREPKNGLERTVMAQRRHRARSAASAPRAVRSDDDQPGTSCSSAPTAAHASRTMLRITNGPSCARSPAWSSRTARRGIHPTSYGTPVAAS